MSSPTDATMNPNDNLHEQLERIGLRTVATQLNDVLANAARQRWSPRQLLEQLAQIEVAERAHRNYAVGIELVQRQLEQARPLFSENLGDGTIAIVGPRPLMRNLVAPLQSLAVALLQSGERARRPERIAHIANRPLHAPFLVTRAHLAGTRLEVIMPGQLQKPLVDRELVAMTLQHGILEFFCAAIFYVE